MKKIIVSALFVGSLMASSLTAADVKIATIDMQVVFKNYYKTAEAEQQIQASSASNKAQFDGMMAEYGKLRDQAAALQNEITADSTSSEAAKKGKIDKLNGLVGELQKKEQEIKTNAAQLEKFMTDQQMRLRKNIIEEITKAIEIYSKGKYTLVF
ncbi:MAG: OmpH family outer membrane protein, partial [Verrucomicrobiales bacterium]|nr:OmpH family outer membrane protein [Verrucomicrobiales bacterium]